MDVRLHHERIATHRLDRLRFQCMPCTYDQIIDLLQGLGPEFNQVVLDAPPIKIDFLSLPIANAHDLPQAPMVFRQVLQLVIIQVAAQPHARQHRDLPIVHAASPTVVVGALVHILAHQTQEFPPQLSIAIQVLQRPQDRDDLISTIQIQSYIADGQAIQTLFGTSQTHVNFSGKIGILSRGMPTILHLGRRLTYNLRYTIRSKTQEISSFFHFATDTS